MTRAGGRAPIAIVGAGLGGLTAALALAQRGFKVDVYEQAVALGEIGAGLHISPNGMHVMRALGLGDALDAVAARPRSIATQHYASGDVNFENLFDDEFITRFGAPFYSFHRADLHALLTRAAHASDAIKIHLDHRLVDLVELSEDVTLKFANGTEVAADAAVGGDGVHSIIRQRLHGDVSTEFTGHVAYRGMVAAEDIDAASIAGRLNIWVGPGKHVVAYPVRRGELVNYVALIEEEGWVDESWTVEAEATGLKAAFEDWNDTVRTLVDRTRDGECYKWALLGRPPLPYWSSDHITLLGDAAHPMVPYLAQGLVMAIEDSWVLAAALSAEPDRAKALKTYEQARLKRTTRIQSAGWEQGQLNHAVGRDARGDNFKGGKFADPGWIYGHNVVEDFPL